MHHRLATNFFTAITTLLLACTTPADEPTPEATSATTPEPTATASPTSELSTTPTPQPTESPATPTPTPTPTPDLTATVTGLFSDPRPRDPDAIVQLGPQPASPLPEHDRLSVVLYDTQLHTVRVFGPGRMGVFSPDSRHMAWEEWPQDRDEPATLHVIDLHTGDIRNLGLSRGVRRFEDDRHVRITAYYSLREQLLVDIYTRERKQIGDIAAYTPPSPSDRYGLTSTTEDSRRTFHIFDKAPGIRLFTIEARAASFASEHELVVLIDAGEGFANIFLLDLDTRVATFVATSAAEPFRFPKIPLIANASYVVWTPSYCNGSYYFNSGDSNSIERGNTTIYNRATGAITEFADSALWIAGFTPDGRLIDGGFGGTALIDPTTLTWDTVLPPGTGDVTWSPDYRYASRGEPSGHGGPCN